MLNINNCLCVFYLLLKCTEKHICPPLVHSPDIHNNLTPQAAARSLEFILDLPCGWQGSKLLEQSASQCSQCQEAVTGRRAGTSRRAVQYGNADITCSLLNNPFIFISSKFIVKLYQLKVFFSLPWNFIQYIIPNFIAQILIFHSFSNNPVVGYYVFIHNRVLGYHFHFLFSLSLTLDDSYKSFFTLRVSNPDWFFKNHCFGLKAECSLRSPCGKDLIPRIRLLEIMEELGLVGDP